MTFLSTVITSGAELVAYHNEDMQGGEEEQLPIQRRLCFYAFFFVWGLISIEELFGANQMIVPYFSFISKSI